MRIDCHDYIDISSGAWLFFLFIALHFMLSIAFLDFFPSFFFCIALGTTTYREQQHIWKGKGNNQKLIHTTRRVDINPYLFFEHSCLYFFCCVRKRGGGVREGGTVSSEDDRRMGGKSGGRIGFFVLEKKCARRRTSFHSLFSFFFSF